jgi:drug/metabolite transporter (DMT)-like permease
MFYSLGWLFFGVGVALLLLPDKRSQHIGGMVLCVLSLACAVLHNTLGGK